MKTETPIVRELRDIAARFTEEDEFPFDARKSRIEWKASDYIEQLEAERDALKLALAAAIQNEPRP